MTKEIEEWIQFITQTLVVENVWFMEVYYTDNWMMLTKEGVRKLAYQFLKPCFQDRSIDTIAFLYRQLENWRGLFEQKCIDQQNSIKAPFQTAEDVVRHDKWCKYYMNTVDPYLELLKELENLLLERLLRCAQLTKCTPSLLTARALLDFSELKNDPYVSIAVAFMEDFVKHL